MKFTETTFDSPAMKLLCTTLDIDIEKAKCYICGSSINKDNWGGLVPPDKMICKSALCIAEHFAIDEGVGE